MTTPKKITEEQAQQLANDWNVFIAVDEEFSPFWFEKEPYMSLTYWIYPSTNGGRLPFRILSTRPWTEQIWRPE